MEKLGRNRSLNALTNILIDQKNDFVTLKSNFSHLGFTFKLFRLL